MTPAAERDLVHALDRELWRHLPARISMTRFRRPALPAKPVHTLALILPLALAAAVTAGCGKTSGPAQDAADAAQPSAAQPSAATTTPPPDAAASQAEADREAQIAAKEKELAEREAYVKQKELEAELARRDAENAAAAAAAAKTAANKSAAASRSASSAKTPAVAAATPAQPPPPPPIVVPAGTGISVALASETGTKTAKVGDPVEGRLAADLVVDGRRAAAAGAPVRGSVTKVVSGSSKVGGTPTLAIRFDSLVAASGANVVINAAYKQQGTSDTAKDTAKIVGGAAAGAIIGHQVSHKHGSVVGGVLGGAAGTAIAQGTGGEVTLPAGTVVNVTTGSAFQVDGG